MTRADAAAVILWTGATLYAVFGGADFGAGLWDLVAGDAEKGARPRALIQRSLAPVWEANHVWLIFILVVLWTAFPEAFGALMSTLYVPLALAALGIVLRGAGFAFRKSVESLQARRAMGAAFAISSVLTPFFMGTAVGAVAAGNVPADGNGDAFSTWIAPLPLLVGALFVTSGAYLAAVFLIADAREADLERYFAHRALAAAVVAGVLAVAGIFALHDEARYLYDRLTDQALPLVIVSGLCGIGVLALLLFAKAEKVSPVCRTPAMEEEFVLLEDSATQIFVWPSRHRLRVAKQSVFDRPSDEFVAKLIQMNSVIGPLVLELTFLFYLRP